jgi:hypothetical protein
MTDIKLPEDHPYRHGRNCTVCGVFKEANHYTLEQDSRAFKGVAMRSQCKPCREHIKWKTFIKRTYGIDADIYYEMLESQNYKCAICGTEGNNSINKTKMFIDHCHDSGKVRGLLCSKCNMALGNFNDDIQTLKNAIAYLTKFEKEI